MGDAIMPGQKPEPGELTDDKVQGARPLPLTAKLWLSIVDRGLACTAAVAVILVVVTPDWVIATLVA